MKVKTLAFVNGKGGCSKTTSLFHLVGELAKRGEKTLVLDLDRQCNLSTSLLIDSVDGENGESTIKDIFQKKASFDEALNKVFIRHRGNANPRYVGIDIIKGDADINSIDIDSIDIKKELEEFIIKNEYKWVLVDMPPANNALNKLCFTQIVKNVVIPFTSDYYSISGYGDLLDDIATARDNNQINVVGVYLSRYMKNCAVDRYIKEQLITAFGNDLMETVIPLKADIREGVLFGRPMAYYKPKSQSTKAYQYLLKEIEERIEG